MTGSSKAAAKPFVGVGVLLFKGDKVLVGKRLSKTGQGEFALPGGHLELGESLEDCASRELQEETGISIPSESFTFSTIQNCVFSETVHCVSVFMQATAPEDAEAVNMEPLKCGGWQWARWPEGIPSPVFKPLRMLVEAGTVPPR